MAKKWILGYKVVNVCRGEKRLQSACQSDLHGGIAYRVGARVGYDKAAQGPLFVFDSLQHAMGFAAPGERAYLDNLRVYKCWYLPSRHNKGWYKEEREGCSIVITLHAECVARTVLARKVILIEEVPRPVVATAA